MIILRIAGGIRQHFGMRVTEWIMTGALFGWSAVLAGDPSTFSTARAFAVIASYGDEAMWANICLFAGLLRLGALTVNGTFRQFRFSPHLRAGASIASCVFWGQIALGVLIAWLTLGGGGTGVIAYSTFMAIEMWNLFRAWADVGAGHRRL
ncbi:hypothetical protein [Mesorhizobium sp. B2-1-3A]|uniref:hypothetical protein n=1 Tax=Mesorhizobium sp. B2-1-3A TaxID=2589971 RepID=UPI00112636A0|nr:hypothetical protein [Mesorhizobium sp. B2-1-3A]TPM92742.1 hypothetical protein FJ977_28080 [Mesorhizobium sp. B2-1-3A]